MPTTLTISPSAVAFSFVGESRALAARVRDQNDGLIESEVTWSSSDPSAVTIDGTGLATAVANGSSTVTATASGLTATLEIAVEIVARSVLVSQGDDQEAIAGNALPDSIIVTLLDLGGTPVGGAEVSFVPDSAAGTVRDSVVVANEAGVASTVWTLGSAFGPVGLTISSGAAERTLSAFARSATPIPDLVFASTDVFLSRGDPTPFDSLTVTATVLNQGDLATGGPFRVSAVVDDVELGFTEEAALDPDEEREVSVTLTGLPSGAQDLRLELDRGDALPELLESNNEVTRSVNVLQQVPISLGVPVTGLSASVGEELLFVLEVPAGAGDVLNITISDADVGPVDDLDLFVAQGRRPGFRENYPDCVSANPSTAEGCQIVFPEGTYHILLHAWEDLTPPFVTTTGFTDITLEASIGTTIEPYDLEYTLLESFTPEQEQAIAEAVAYWEDIIRGDIPALEGSSGLQNPCGLGQPDLTSVDDMMLYVGLVADSLQGPGGTLAQAGPCPGGIRGITHLPALGVARFDPVDLETFSSEDVFRVMLHEIGHALGIGSIWTIEGLLQDPSTEFVNGQCQQKAGDQDTHFTGQGARAAFNQLVPGYAGGSIVPVENQASCGSADSHWRESVLDTEIMTPGYDGGVLNPMSAITIRSLEDLGYGVDVSRAEPFSPPSPSPSRVSSAVERQLDLRNDVIRLDVDELGPKSKLRRDR